MDSDIITAVDSPIGIFVISFLVCNAVFAVCAAKFNDQTSLKYCMHMFLGVLFFFGSILLWSPAHLYHPSELKGLNIPSRPWIPTIATFAGVLIYMAYYGIKSWSKNQKK